MYIAVYCYRYLCYGSFPGTGNQNLKYHGIAISNYQVNNIFRFDFFSTSMYKLCNKFIHAITLAFIPLWFYFVVSSQQRKFSLL